MMLPEFDPSNLSNPSNLEMVHFWVLRPWVLHAPGAMMTVVNTNSFKKGGWTHPPGVERGLIMH